MCHCSHPSMDTSLPCTVSSRRRCPLRPAYATVRHISRIAVVGMARYFGAFPGFRGVSVDEHVHAGGTGWRVCGVGAEAYGACALDKRMRRLTGRLIVLGCWVALVCAALAWRLMSRWTRFLRGHFLVARPETPGSRLLVLCKFRGLGSGVF